jgi:ATP-dependent DNA ligase
MVENILSDLRSSSSIKDKEAVLKKYDSNFLRALIVYAYDPFKQFTVSIKEKEIPEPGTKIIHEMWYEIEEMFYFCEHSKSNKQNRELVIKVLESLNQRSQELIVNTLNKNWKAGVSVKTLLKVFPDIVSQFNVQLSNTFKADKHDCSGWAWSYKLDGLRCVALREKDGTWSLNSRQGKRFLTVEHLKPQLENLYQQSGHSFFDGELYKHGLKFEQIQGTVMGFTKGQATDMDYHIFVAGNAEIFLSGADVNSFSILYEGVGDQDNLSFVTKGKVESNEHIGPLMDEAFENGYEGIMLRDPKKPYDYKRSDALLKHKENEGEGEIISDCIVTRLESDKFPVISEEGEMYYDYMIVRMFVQQEDGLECKVGSGFDMDFRRYYHQRPWELVGKTVEVKHQQWGSNGRMRFPRLYKVREDL